MKSFSDFIRETNLMEFAINHGYCHNKSKGNKWPVLVNENIGDTVIIGEAYNGSHQYYWNPLNDNDRGTIIQFVRNRLGILFANSSLKKQAENINAVLYNYLHLSVPEKNGYQNFRKNVKEVFDTELLHPLKIADYLINQRCIKLDTLQDEVFAGSIMQIVQHNFVNIAFPYFDINENIVGAELCNNGFKAHAAGSDKSNGVWHSNILATTKNIVICESGIDALSYHQLKGTAENLYISVGGHLSQGQINTIVSVVKKIYAKKIIGAFDNDDAGKKFNQMCSKKIDNFFMDMPIKKDFNEDVKSKTIKLI